MANKLFVGSLAWGVDDNMLYQAFASFGQISEAKVMMERDDPGKSRGFGFVTFVDPSCAERAAGEMNGQDLGGRCINVEPPQMGGGKGGGKGGGGGGGYGGRGGGGGFRGGDY